MKEALMKMEVARLQLKTKLADKTGSWFTEDFGRIAIVVVLALIIVAAMVVIIGDENTGILGLLADKIESIFNAAPGAGGGGGGGT